MTTHPLTPRQLEACALYAQGLRAQEIADRMRISRTAVYMYLEGAKQRMGARTVGQLMFLLGREVRGVEVR
jgi:DNA-binding CsgD family transcriptional regulator